MQQRLLLEQRPPEPKQVTYSSSGIVWVICLSRHVNHAAVHQERVSDSGYHLLLELEDSCVGVLWLEQKLISREKMTDVRVLFPVVSQGRE